ncbi:MAG TPA: RHS repeat-associated core domain-containing protein [Terriglobia bacterium]|nr:RHS repeat-associated core domain-containing protein [Terriglobia bacterium]
MTRKIHGFQGLVGAGVALLLLLLPGVMQAKYVGAEPPPCQGCKCKCGGVTSPSSSCEGGSIGNCVSNTEGNQSEQYNVSNVRSGFGPALSLSLTYNSYNADGSRAQLDTGMGYGWTHSYNIFLFSQLGNMFRMDGQGRVTKYQYNHGGTYTAAPGYFETLTNNMNGTFTIRQKDGTTFLFGQIPNTPFLVFGPVYRLESITDRNNNVTTVSYDSHGNLTQVTDTYTRSVTFVYNAQHELTSITDPVGRVTTVTYDSSGRRVSQITDPLGRVTQYSYNTLSQMTQKVDKDGRVFTYSYTQLEPTGINNGGSLFSLANPNNWATSNTMLAEYQTRVYTPSTTSKTDGRGNVWKYTYDSNGHVTSAVAPDGATTSYTYDPGTLEVASMTDANGNKTSYQYDSEGNLLQQTDAPIPPATLGFVTTFTYEPTFNQVTSMTDPNGRITRYFYDGNGNRIKTMDPLGNSETWTYDSHGNVLTHTDKNNNQTTYTYDANGNLATATDALLNVTTTLYDTEGNLTSRTDANHHTTTYTYDDLDRVVTVTDPLGKTTTTVYDGQGNVAQVTDRDGHVTKYQYDVRNRLIKTTDALGHTVTSAYDSNDNVVSTTDQNNHTTQFFYDARNRLIKTVDALGDTSTTAYDAFGNVLTTTDANHHAITYTYDALNRQVTSTDAVGSVTTTVYDSTGPNTGPCTGVCTGPTEGSNLPSKVTDGDGKVTYYKYDGLDRRIQEVRKQGSTADVEPPVTDVDAVTSTTYDAVGNVLTVTEPDGNTTTNGYDADNRRIKETDAAGDVTTWAYDGVGNVTSTTEPTSNVINNAYDADDRIITVTDSIGNVASYTYDGVGNQLTWADGNGNTTTTTYDVIYRVTQVTDPLGQNTTYSYDAVGNQLTVTDRNSNVTSYAYDTINRRISTTDALGNTTGYQYDAVGNRTVLTDANNHATTYSYDAVNRVVKETYADGSSRGYAYDFVGNPTSRTDQNGVTTNYAYSDLYFLTSRAYPSTTDTFTYDLSGRMASATHGSWTVNFTYDGADRVLSDVQNGRTVSYIYQIPAPTTRTLTYPGSRVITESMDLRTRISQINDVSSPPIVTYTYDAGDRVLSRNYRNGTTAAYTYNGNDWVTNLQHSFGVTPIAGFAYVYDNEGNKKCENKLQNLAQSEAYQYDAIYRLTHYAVGTLNVSPPTCTVAGVPSTQTQYTLDPVGNWQQKVTNAITETRVHNAVNEITSITDTPPGTAASLSYDLNGNLTADSLYTYAYDEENRLTLVTRKSDSRMVGQYQYDALSRRVQKIADPATPSTPTTTQYFYDDARVIEEQNGGGTQATYVYGNYIDEVLTMDRPAGTPYYYHQNELWSVEAVTDSTGTPAERYSYDVYGFVTVTNGTGTSISQNAWNTPHSAIGNPWVFTGRQLDEETGLHFYRARYYDPNKGRFLQRDPVEDEDWMDLYEYVSDMPTFAADPLGLLAPAHGPKQGHAGGPPAHGGGGHGGGGHGGGGHGGGGMPARPQQPRPNPRVWFPVAGSAVPAPAPQGQQIDCDSVVPALFPNLKAGEWSITGPAIPEYNCIAWSVGVTNQWVWPGNTEAVFDKLYKEGLTVTPRNRAGQPIGRPVQIGGGYKDSDNCDPECHKRKVALFVDEAGVPTHAAREVEDGGVWESKLGSLCRIKHKLTQLEGATQKGRPPGTAYGKVKKCYEKDDPTANQALCPCPG